MSTIQANLIEPSSGTTVTFGASGDTVALGTGAGVNFRSSRNMIINGNMQVAQRGTSSTDEGYKTVDRFRVSVAGLDEDVTQAQHALTSSDTGPWAKGFRNSYHITNGNQTSGAGAADRVCFQYRSEAQDIDNSGWDYTSGSSYITLSFWIKSSVAQNFYGRLETMDGTQQGYAFETGSLSADTWTKITKTIPGNSNITFDNDANNGLIIEIVAFRGTDKTGSMSLDTWAAYNSAVRVPDMTSTWFTTDDATFEITGVQLEVGSTATPFENKSYGQELEACQRYCQKLHGEVTNSMVSMQLCYSTTGSEGVLYYSKKRVAPTITQYSAGATGWYLHYENTSSVVSAVPTFDSIDSTTCRITALIAATSLQVGEAAYLRTGNAAGSYIIVDAEL